MIAIEPAPLRELNETTRMASSETVLSPRFYTTDFAAMDAIDIEPVRAEWDRLMAEFRADPNKGHFVRNELFEQFRMDALPEPLQKELLDFLVSSVTAEFSAACCMPRSRSASRTRMCASCSP
jgi:magnesium-protoporphyrin IX monomethyl ester (oxidative) cyclase